MYPKVCAEGLTSPIHDKAKSLNAKDYHRITVQCAIGKIVDTMIKKRLKPWTKMTHTMVASK